MEPWLQTPPRRGAGQERRVARRGRRPPARVRAVPRGKTRPRISRAAPKAGESTMRERCETDHQVAEGEETQSNRRKEERAKPRLIPNQEADLVPFWVALILVVMLWAHGFGGEGPSASTQPWSPHPTLWAPILAPGRLTDARLRAEAAGAAWRAGLGDDENHSVAIFNHAWRSRPPRSPPRAAPRRSSSWGEP